MHRLVSLILLSGCLLSPVGAVADAPAAACDSLGPWAIVPGNFPAVATDGRLAVEGGVWNSDLAHVLAAGESAWLDLGEDRVVRSALIQADADESWRIEGAGPDGAFVQLAVAPALTELSGLRTRAVSVDARAVRYVRISASGGDGRSSLAEIQLFCPEIADWRPDLAIVPSEGEAEADGRFEWNDLTSRWWELILALLALGLLAWERNAPSTKPPHSPARERQSIRVHALAFGLAILTYFNFGAFHFGNFVHAWDAFHYYLGAKYFPELRYDGLYDCVAVADAGAGAVGDVGTRQIRDLRRNVLVPIAEVIARPERCTERFEAARWSSFERDVARFRSRMTPARWAEMTTDHGFNATPVWMIAGTFLANGIPVEGHEVELLAAIDPILFLLMAATLVWGFGIRTAAVAMLVLATSFPARFFWAGGAYLRWDWLLFTVAAIALLRRGRPLAAGAALGYAALLRLFPILLAAGALLAVAQGFVRWLHPAVEKSSTFALRFAGFGTELRPHLRFLAGIAASVLCLATLTLAFTGGSGASGIQTWREFARNTAKHKETPLTNNMGLMTVLSYRPQEIGRRLHSENASEPWASWKEARLAARRTTKPLQLALFAGSLALLGLAIRRSPEPWVVAALSAATIPFALEMTCYYYAFLIVPALLWREKKAAGAILLSLSAIGQFVGLAPLPGMPTWRDEIYTWVSLFTVLALGALLVLFARARTAVPQR